MNDALLAGIEAHIGDGSQSVVEEVSVDDVAHEIIVSCLQLYSLTFYLASLTFFVLSINTEKVTI